MVIQERDRGSYSECGQPVTYVRYLPVYQPPHGVQEIQNHYHVIEYLGVEKYLLHFGLFQFVIASLLVAAMTM